MCDLIVEKLIVDLFKVQTSVAATRLTGLGSLEPWFFTGYGSVSRTDWSDSA